MLIISITIFLLLLYAILINYYRNGWVRLREPEIRDGGSTKISVIIPARNESQNIEQCLRSVTDQSYPDELYEVILVDDFSTDDTAKIARSFKKVRVISLQESGIEPLNSYKKKAIETGISHAEGDLIITTDADCDLPATWLQSITSFYEQHRPACIAAPVCYYGENNFLKIFQSLDFMTLQGITGAALARKFHTMGNGANLAYEKKIFYEVEGFSGIDQVASGDDMLLVNKIAAKHSVMFLKSKQAIVKTPPAEDFRAFINQRIRWASKSDKYNDKKIIGVLMLVYLFNVWILLLAVLCFIYPYLLWWLAATLLLKTVVELFFLYPVARFFNKEKMLWWFPVAQPFHILYTVVAGWLGRFGSYKWKGRKVK